MAVMSQSPGGLLAALADRQPNWPRQQSGKVEYGSLDVLLRCLDVGRTSELTPYNLKMSFSGNTPTVLRKTPHLRFRWPPGRRRLWLALRDDISEFTPRFATIPPGHPGGFSKRRFHKSDMQRFWDFSLVDCRHGPQAASNKTKALTRRVRYWCGQLSCCRPNNLARRFGSLCSFSGSGGGGL